MTQQFKLGKLYRLNKSAPIICSKHRFDLEDWVCAYKKQRFYRVTDSQLFLAVEEHIDRYHEYSTHEELKKGEVITRCHFYIPVHGVWTWFPNPVGLLKTPPSLKEAVLAKKRKK